MRAWREGLNFRELVTRDPELARSVPAKVVQGAFDLKRQLRNIDAIFAQVFNRKNGGKIRGRKGKTTRLTRTRSKRTARSKAS